MADHGDDLVVDELLRNLRGLARVGRVVLRVQLQRDLLAADRQPFRVDFLDRETCAVLVVLAEVGDAARRRFDAADLHDLVGHRARRGRERGGGQCNGDQGFAAHADNASFHLPSPNDWYFCWRPADRRPS
ncbi:hypothetical protein BDSB_26260 [Burkholderia dolosa PC543]|nr:hypothetical protein BDSB_26260 [Burkholderia dolosa PC543]